MAKRLDALELDEISLVPRGANQHARILLAKEAPEPRMTGIAKFVTALRSAFGHVATSDEQKAAIEKELDTVVASLAAPVDEVLLEDADAEDVELEDGDESEVELSGEGDEDEDEDMDDIEKEDEVDVEKGCGECKDGKPCKKHKMQKEAAQLDTYVGALHESLASIFKDGAETDRAALVATSISEFQAAVLGAANPSQEDVMPAPEKSLDDIRKELPEAMRAHLEKVEKAADEAAEAVRVAKEAELVATNKAAALEQEKIQKEAAVSVKDMLGNVAGDPAAVAKALLQLPAEDRAVLESVLKSAGEISKQSPVFGTVGKDGPAPVAKGAEAAEARLQSIAKEFEATGMRASDAYRRAMAENPQLVSEADPTPEPVAAE